MCMMRSEVQCHEAYNLGRLFIILVQKWRRKMKIVCHGSIIQDRFIFYTSILDPAVRLSKHKLEVKLRTNDLFQIL